MAAVYLVAVVGLFATRGYPFAVGTIVREYGKFLLAILAFSLPLWLAARGLELARRRFEPRAARDDLLVLSRSLITLLIVLVAYTNLKSRILLFHSRLFDDSLVDLDAALHFGGGDFLGWTLAQTHDPVASARWATVYFFAWAALALPYGVAFAIGRARAARRLTTALSLTWVAGSLLYLALPALGPAFAYRQRFAHLAGTWGYEVQSSMLEAMLWIVRHPQAPAVPFFGIAAFPSLHLAISSLGLFAAWKWYRPLLLLLVPWNLAIAWSALYYGWHYAIDFYPGIALAWGGWWAAGRLLPVPR